MKKTIVDDILRKMQKSGSMIDVVRKKVPESRPRKDADPEDDEYMPIGVEGLLSATEKLLAVNRELDQPDHRDSLIFKKFMTTDKLLAERVTMDANKTRMRLMPMLAKQRSFRNLTPYAFDGYTTGYLMGNPLVTPLEEINPMHLVEQSRRVTQMGPGGIGTDNAITEDMQSVSPDQFGFLSSIEGPECLDEQSEVYTVRGWVPWPDVKDDDIFACRVEGRLEWHKASRIVREKYTGPLIVGEHETIRMAVTPTHRILNTRGNNNYRVDTAADVVGKNIKVPIRHAPYIGDESMLTFSLPEIDKTGNSQKIFSAFTIEDWCAFIGWWLSEGNAFVSPKNSKYNHERHSVCITQCRKANPENYNEIQQLCAKMKICNCDNGITFISRSKQLSNYFSQWKNGCYDKWIPEELQHAPVYARERMLDALLKGDGRYTKKRNCYCTVSKNLAYSVERLAIGLGYTAFIRVEKDNRAHVKTTNYVVSIHRQQHRQIIDKIHTDKRSGALYGGNWRVDAYDGYVYCATVPGGFLHVRGKQSNSGYWTGNSERIGIDTRLAWGTKIGSDGKLYQIVYDRKRKKHRWVSPSDLADSIVKLPD